jgi:hypothetical protein
MHNKAAVAGVFAAIALILLAVIAVGTYCLCLRRQKRRHAKPRTVSWPVPVPWNASLTDPFANRRESAGSSAFPVVPTDEATMSEAHHGPIMARASVDRGRAVSPASYEGPFSDYHSVSAAIGLAVTTDERSLPPTPRTAAGEAAPVTALRPSRDSSPSRYTPSLPGDDADSFYARENLPASPFKDPSASDPFSDPVPVAEVPPPVMPIERRTTDLPPPIRPRSSMRKPAPKVVVEDVQLMTPPPSVSSHADSPSLSGSPPPSPAYEHKPSLGWGTVLDPAREGSEAPKSSPEGSTRDLARKYSRRTLLDVRA